MSHTISHHEALIYLMVLTSAADATMTDAELQTIGDVVQKFPVFADFDQDRLTQVASECAELMSQDNGLNRVLDIAHRCVPERLRETAYAAVVEVASADESVAQEELRVLELVRNQLGIDRLASAAIERSARARHRTL